MILMFKFIHGEHFTIYDVVLTYAGGLAVACMLIISSQTSLDMLPLLALCVLALDIGGGTIANLTDSTSKFYAARASLRWVFIGLHVIQPSLLAWIFPDAVLFIGCVTAFVLTSSALVNGLSGKQVQKLAAMFALIVAVAGVVLFGQAMSPAVKLILILFGIKLILAFPVDWSHR